jgi:hypothetical protein
MAGRRFSVTTITKTTRFTMYEQAISQLEEAAEALDQAHASMKDAQVDDVRSYRSNGLSVRSIVSHVEALIDELKKAECGECDHKLSQHGDRYGCEHERGDVPMTCRDGGTVDAAAGPCGCRWGLEAGGSR